jgi:hypothetical protein
MDTVSLVVEHSLVFVVVENSLEFAVMENSLEFVVNSLEFVVVESSFVEVDSVLSVVAEFHYQVDHSVLSIVVYQIDVVVSAVVAYYLYTLDIVQVDHYASCVVHFLVVNTDDNMVVVDTYLEVVDNMVEDNHVVDMACNLEDENIEVVDIVVVGHAEMILGPCNLLLNVVVLYLVEVIL